MLASVSDLAGGVKAVNATQDDVEVSGDKALLSFLTREQHAFLTCQRTSLAVRVVVLASFFVPLIILNPIDASWLYAFLACYISFEVIAVLSERAATKKVHQQLASLIKYREQTTALACLGSHRAGACRDWPQAGFRRGAGADAGVLLFARYPGLFSGADFGEVLYAARPSAQRQASFLNGGWRR